MKEPKEEPPRSGDETTPATFLGHKDEFHDVVDPESRLIRVTSTDAHEGLVYVKEEDALYYTTLPAPTPTSQSEPPTVAIKRLALDGERFPLSPDRVSVVRDRPTWRTGWLWIGEGDL